MVIYRDVNYLPLLLSHQPARFTFPSSCRHNQAQATVKQQLDLPEEAPSAVDRLPPSRERLIKIKQDMTKIIVPLRNCFRGATNR